MELREELKERLVQAERIIEDTYQLEKMVDFVKESIYLADGIDETKLESIFKEYEKMLSNKMKEMAQCLELK